VAKKVRDKEPLSSILRHYLPCKDRPALKTINLANEMRNSRAFIMLLQGTSQQLPDIVWPPWKRVTAYKLHSN